MSQLVGVFRVGKDAEVRDAKGTSVANLALAFNHSRKGGESQTQWIDASLWGKRAEALEQYLTKGQQVYAVIGDPHVETYDKRDGGSASKLVGTILEIELVGGKPAGGSAPRREERAPRREEPKKQAGFDDMDDDIPF